MKGQKNQAEPVAPTRLMALADGVFAIVMTLLVFKLGIPLASGTLADKELSQLFVSMWPKFLIYGLSFLILGVFWLMHHAIFDGILYCDFPLCWINILFLMFVGLIPFGTLLVGVFGLTKITSIAYGVNLLLVQFMCWSLWLYASGNLRLIKRDPFVSFIILTFTVPPGGLRLSLHCDHLAHMRIRLPQLGHRSTTSVPKEHSLLQDFNAIHLLPPRTCLT